MSKQPITKLKTEPSKAKPTELKALIETEILMVMLAKHPGLRRKLLDALETERFFITLSFQKKLKPDDPNDLQHFWQRMGFMANDVLPSLRHIANDYKAKEMPNAEVEGDGWH